MSHFPHVISLKIKVTLTVGSQRNMWGS